MMGHEWLTGVGLVLLGIITGFVGTNTGGSNFFNRPGDDLAGNSGPVVDRYRAPGFGRDHGCRTATLSYSRKGRLCIGRSGCGIGAGRRSGRSEPAPSNRSSTAAQSHWRADIAARRTVPDKKTFWQRNTSLSDQASVWLYPLHSGRNDRRVVRWTGQTFDVSIHYLLQKNHQRIGGYPQSRRAHPLGGLTYNLRRKWHH
ncbi:hypothetical protein QFZ38_004374 [Pseudomonas cedrina]|nr:hypothetical protein [Pseudomonas cedrina]